MEGDKWLTVGLALAAGAAGFAAWSAYHSPPSNFETERRAGTLSGTGSSAVQPVKVSPLKAAVASRGESLQFASLKPFKKPARTPVGALPSSGGPSSAPKPPSSIPTPIKAPFVPNGVIRPGPNWGGWSPPVRPLTAQNGGEFVKIVEGVLDKKVPKGKGLANVPLAQALVTVAYQEKFPLDLLLAWAGVEGGFLSQTMENGTSSRAIGPLQMTPGAFAEVGLSYPGGSTLERIRAGVRYFRFLRSKHPECASSLTATFRVYGMGWGNYQKFKSVCHNGVVTASSSVTVWQREAKPVAKSYTGQLFSYAKLPLLHTMDWRTL